jgi:hypothetical protein
MLAITIGNKRKKETETAIYDLTDFVEVRGWKAIGNKVAESDLLSAEFLEMEKDESEDEGPKGKGKKNTPAKPAGDSPFTGVPIAVTEDEAQLSLF